jgi:proteic killer suppression protein
MIKSFADKSTAELFERVRTKELPMQILKTAYIKLLLIDAAGNINDLRIPPGNILEKLSGKLASKYSIRINDQWRIVFKWKDNDAYEVEIIDYHKGK